MVESSIVTYPMNRYLTEHDIIDYSVGSPGSVEFNFERIWMFKKTMGRDFNGLSLRFFHVHPSGFDMYSELDMNCMEGLHMAFNSWIYFNIVLFQSDDLWDTKHKVRAYVYHAGGFVLEQPLPPRLSPDQALFLKYLSYGNTRKVQEVHGNAPDSI
jgi:hypothetical protein